MRTRVAVSLVVVALLGVLPVRAEETSSSPVGLWLGAARTQSGLGNWIEIRSDGTVQFSFGALVDGTYRMDGTSLWLSAADEQGEVLVGDVRIDGNTAVRMPRPPADAPPQETMSREDHAMLDRMTQPITMKRLGRATPGAHPIVGTWEYMHPVGVTAQETFTAEGKTFLRVPMQTIRGTYSATAERLVVKLPTATHVFTWKRDALISMGEDDAETTSGPRAEGNIFRRARNSTLAFHRYEAAFRTQAA